jgi:hypothetical protein
MSTDDLCDRCGHPGYAHYIFHRTCAGGEEGHPCPCDGFRPPAESQQEKFALYINRITAELFLGSAGVSTATNSDSANSDSANSSISLRDIEEMIEKLFPVLYYGTSVYCERGKFIHADAGKFHPEFVSCHPDDLEQLKLLFSSRTFKHIKEWCPWPAAR